MFGLSPEALILIVGTILLCAVAIGAIIGIALNPGFRVAVWNTIVFLVKLAGVLVIAGLLAFVAYTLYNAYTASQRPSTIQVPEEVFAQYEAAKIEVETLPGMVPGCWTQENGNPYFLVAMPTQAGQCYAVLGDVFAVFMSNEIRLYAFDPVSRELVGCNDLYFSSCGTLGYRSRELAIRRNLDNFAPGAAQPVSGLANHLEGFNLLEGGSDIAIDRLCIKDVRANLRQCTVSPNN